MRYFDVITRSAAPWIFYFLTFISSSEIRIDAQSCDSEWTLESVSHQCLRHFSTYMTYAEAEAHCASHNATVAAPMMKVVDGFTATTLDGVSSTTWLPLRHDVTTGAWAWSRDGARVTWAAWAWGEPGGRGDCAYTMHGKWYDAACTDTWDVTCQKSANKNQFDNNASVPSTTPLFPASDGIKTHTITVDVTTNKVPAPMSGDSTVPISQSFGSMKTTIQILPSGAASPTRACLGSCEMLSKSMESRSTITDDRLLTVVCVLAAVIALLVLAALIVLAVFLRYRQSVSLRAERQGVMNKGLGQSQDVPEQT